MYTGIYTPTLSMLQADHRGLDFDNWGNHVDNLIDAGIDGILFLGTAGEFYALPHLMRKQVVEWAVEKVAGRCKTFFGIGDAVMTDTIDLATHAAEQGADAVLIVSPYYIPPTHNGALRHFGRVAEAIDVPILLYNIPLASGNDLNPALVAELASKYDNIVGVKDTVDTISHTRKMIRQAHQVRPDFTVWSGFDEYYLLNRLAGGSGILSGLTNVDPALFVAMHRAYERGDFATVAKCQERINVLMRLYEVTPDMLLGGVRAAVKLNGIDYTADPLTPGVPITPDQYRAVEQILAEAADLQI